MKKLKNSVPYEEQRERINSNFVALATRTNDLRTAIDERQPKELPVGVLKSRNLDPSLVTVKASFAAESIASGAFDTRPDAETHSGFEVRGWHFGDIDWFGSGWVNSHIPNGMMRFDHRVYDTSWRGKHAAIDNVTAMSFCVADRGRQWQIEAEAAIDSMESFTTTDGFETTKISGTFTARFSEENSSAHDPEFNFTLYVGAQANVDNTVTTVIDTSHWGSITSSVWYEITNAPEGREDAWRISGIYIAAEGGTNTFATGVSHGMSLGQTLEPNEMLGISCEFATTYSDFQRREGFSVDVTRSINLAMLPVGVTDAGTFPIFVVENLDGDGVVWQNYTQGHMFATLTTDSLNFRTKYGPDVYKMGDYFGRDARKVEHSFNIKSLFAISETRGD